MDEIINIFQAALRSALGPDAAAYALLAIGLNMHFGHAGLANLGQVGFMLIAAYAVGVTATTIGASLWLGILAAILLCALFALLLGLPTLKLRADYFAITTIAAAEILRFLARSTSAVDVTGGPYGLQDVSDDFLRLNPWAADPDRGGLGLFLQNVAGPWAVTTATGLGLLAALSLAAYITLRRRDPVATPASRVVSSPATEAPQPAEPETSATTDTATALTTTDDEPSTTGTTGTTSADSSGSAAATLLAHVPGWVRPVSAMVAGTAGWIALVLYFGHVTVRQQSFARFSYLETQYWAMAVAWTLAILASVVVARLMSSPWGRVVRSIREDEDVASSVGKNVFAYKLQALVAGGIIGGLAGVMTTLANSSVNAVSFVPLVTFFAYVALIVGGVGSRIGPVVGAIIFWFVFRGTRSTLAQMDANGWLPDFLGGADAREAMAAVLMGIVLVVIVAFRPQGLFGKREDMVFGD